MEGPNGSQVAGHAKAQAGPAADALTGEQSDVPPILGLIESDRRLDGAARVLDWCSGRLGRDPLRKVLNGDWLGHVVHPALTDLPIGFWTSASVVDLVGGRSARPMARHLVFAGLLSALPTVLTGLSDFGRLDSPEDRRTGVIHAYGNLAVIACYFGSWRSRRLDHHFRGVAWSVLGGSLATGTAYLGGHLVFRRGAGVAARGFPAADADVAQDAGDGVFPLG